MDVRAQPETVIQLVPGKGPWPRIDLSRSFHCAAVAGAPKKYRHHQWAALGVGVM